MSKWGINQEDEDDLKPTEEMAKRTQGGERLVTEISEEVLQHLTDVIAVDKKQVVQESIDSLTYIGVARRLMRTMGAVAAQMEKSKIPEDHQEAEMARVIGLILKRIIERGAEFKEINDGKA